MICLGSSEQMACPSVGTRFIASAKQLAINRLATNRTTPQHRGKPQSARRRETRQRRSRTLANAVCVTARAPRLARIYCWFSSPQLSQWDEENPRLTALDANRLFDVVILQKCQYCSRRHAATFRPKNHIIVHTQSKYAFRHVGMLHGASGQFSCQQSL